jgi:potassium-dependent mechanosensitive channel
MKLTGITRYVQRIALVWFIFMAAFPVTAWAQAQDNFENQIYTELEKSFTQSIQIQQEKLEALKSELKSTQESEAELGDVYKNMTIQITTYRNLLILPSVTLSDLKIASTEESILLGMIQKSVAAINEKKAELERLKKEINDSRVINEQKLSDIITKAIGIDLQKRLRDQARQLIRLLNDQEEVISQLDGLYADRLKRFKSVESDIISMANSFNAKMEERIRGQTFQRNASPILRIVRGELGEGIGEVFAIIRQFASIKFWAPSEGIEARPYISYIFTLLLIVGIAQAGLVFAARQFKPLKQKCYEENNIWQHTVLFLLERSLPYFGAIAFLYYFPVHADYRLTPIFLFFPLFIQMLFIWLVFLWGRIVIRILKRITGEEFRPELIRHLKRLNVGFLLFASIHTIMGWLISYNNIILVSISLCFEVAFFIWAVALIRIIRSDQMPVQLKAHFVKPAVNILIYIIISGGVIFELAGFSGLATYWYISWVKTAVIFFWTFLLFKVLKESDAAAKAVKTEIEFDEESDQPYPVRWALVRLLRLVLGVVLFIIMPMAWGAHLTYTSDVIDALNYKITIGSIEFNSMGILYAGVFIFVIHILSVVLKSLMKNKILENKKIDTGLKDSIVRITLYTVWGIGFIIVLRLIGISATSLAVVFGAVGIGIGFGLQNMFNNFFSGLILLFERPIQVNDVIEIGGVWGVVKEIKVRSTHIKTYDNADLMIPNSEIVGQQVTNWSFRDPRIRRTITIGVAYGSDVKLVKETLVNIAYNDPRVSRRPNPDVMFSDFGDNALIFKLRFWAHVDYFLRVESDIRSEIDKEFRRLGIGIPFPQRDVYIKEKV